MHSLVRKGSPWVVELDSRTGTSSTRWIEAGMAPTRLTARLLAHAEHPGAKVVAVGEPAARIRGGRGWLAALHARGTGPTLREVMRQRDPGEQRALRELHAATRMLPRTQARRGHRPRHRDRCNHDAHQRVVPRQLQHGRRKAVMIARDNLTRERLNRAARVKLKRDGSSEGST